MRRLGIVIGAAAAVFALLLAVVFTRFDLNRFRTQIQAEMEQRLDRKVTLGNLKLKLIPLHLRVENLAISEDPDFGRQSLFLKADTADLSVRLLPLLWKKVEVDAIEMHRPSVELVKNAKGVWNFSSLGAGGHETSSGGASPVRMEGNLTLHDGQVAITSLQARGSRRVYDHIDMKIRDFAPGKLFSIDAVARISSQGGQGITLEGDVGPLSEVAADRTPFNGKLRLRTVAVNGLRNFLNTPFLAKTDGIVSGETSITTKDGKLSAVGSMKLENARINGVEIGYPITAQYNLTGDPVTDVITIFSSTIGLGTAPVSVSGSVNLQPTPFEVDLNADSKGASVGEVTRLASAFGIAFAPDTTATGQMDGHLQIRGPADNPALNGKVSARDLRIVRRNVQQAVQVASLDLSMTPKEIRSNNFEVRSGNTTAAAHFGLAQYTSKSPTIDFALRSSNAELREVLAMARAYRAQGLEGIDGSGTLNLDVHASGPVQSVRSSEIMKRLNGNANINFNSVHIAGLDIEHELASIGGLKKSGPSRPGTDINHLTGQFVVKNGIAQTNDLRAVLGLTNVAAAGSTNLSSHVLNFRATAIVSKAANQGIAGAVVGTISPVLANSGGELVIPAIIAGTWERPKFEPDMQQFTMMQLKGIVPTSDNPFGVLGTLLGQGKQNKTNQPSQSPINKGINKFLGKIPIGKN